MKIIGSLITLRDVEIKDAKFILELRQNEELNKYISLTSTSLVNQEEWLKNYSVRKENKKEYYFIIFNNETKVECGTVRLYDIDLERKESTWGSFILGKNRPNMASYEVVNLSLNFAFNKLDLNLIKLEVKKENEKAIHIYKKIGFEFINEDLENQYYEINKKKFKEIKL